MNSLLKRSKYFIGLGLAGLVVFGGIFTFLAPQQQALAATGSWLSSGQISYNGQTFSGPSVNGSNGLFRYTSLTAVSCTDPSTGVITKRWDYIEFKTNPTVAGNSASPGYYDDWSTYAPASSGIAGADNCDKKSANTAITLLATEKATLTRAGAACAGKIYSEQAACVQAQAANICKNSGTGYDACVAAETGAVPATGVVPGQSADNSGPNSTDPSLDSSTGCDFGGNPFTWFICPMVGILEQAIRVVDNFIMSSLEFDVESVFVTQPGYYIAWNSFRIIATALLIIAGLVMIASQALGFEFLDAYTTKKVLPKLLIATIGISLSWPLMRFAIEFVNMLGFDIRNLIYSPFSSLGGTLGGSTLFAANAGFLAALFFLGPGAILSFLVTAALAVLVGFIIIIVRNLALIVLILMAPIAIAGYVLPNTSKLWTLWKDNFLGLLLVFPIISAFIAIGRVFSAVSLQGAGTDTTGAGTVSQIVGFVAYFLPYFLLPIAFRLATGVIGAVAGFVNDRNRGAFDRLKKYRGGQVAKNVAKNKNYQRYNERTKFGRGMNAALGAVANPSQGLLHGRKGVRMGRSAGRVNQGMASMKDNAIVQANQNDDNFLLALANENLAKNKIDQDQKKFEAARQQAGVAQAAGDNEGYEKAMSDANKAQQSMRARQKGLESAKLVQDRKSTGVRLGALNALAKTGYQFSDDEEGYKELSSTVNDIVGPDQGSRAAAMDEAQYHLKNAGRFDLGGINHGAGFSRETGLGKASGYALGNGKIGSIYGGARHYLGADTYDKNTGKTRSAEDIATIVQTRLASGDVSADKVAEWHAMLSDVSVSGTEGNRQEARKQLDALDTVRQSSAPLQDALRKNYLRRTSGMTPDEIARLSRGES